MLVFVTRRHGRVYRQRIRLERRLHQGPDQVRSQDICDAAWARLLERVFAIDVEHCPHCGGDLTIISAIEEPAVIAKILTHLGLPARAPPHSPARPLTLFQVA